MKDKIWIEGVDREIIWFINAADTMMLVAMCKWKSAGICILAAKVRWYEH